MKGARLSFCIAEMPPVLSKDNAKIRLGERKGNLFLCYSAVVADCNLRVGEVSFRQTLYFLCHDVLFVESRSASTLLYEGVYFPFYKSAIGGVYCQLQHGGVARHPGNVYSVWRTEVSEAVGYEMSFV